MEIRHGTLEDLSRIMELYAQARAFMASRGNPRQWGATNWPPEELIRQDMATGRCFVCTRGERIIGVFFFDRGHRVEDTYDVIDGAWLGSEDYGVVHRIAGDGSEPGIGRFCINWAYEQCGHLRMDTHGDNKVMQKVLTDLGFQYCGIIYIREDKDPRLAYERL